MHWMACSFPIVERRRLSNQESEWCSVILLPTKIQYWLICLPLQLTTFIQCHVYALVCTMALDTTYMYTALHVDISVIEYLTSLYYFYCSYIFDFFETAGLTPATSVTLMEQCSKAISFLTTTGKSLHKNGNNIQKMLDAVKVWFLWKRAHYGLSPPLPFALISCRALWKRARTSSPHGPFLRLLDMYMHVGVHVLYVYFGVLDSVWSGIWSQWAEQLLPPVQGLHQGGGELEEE